MSSIVKATYNVPVDFTCKRFLNKKYLSIANPFN